MRKIGVGRSVLKVTTFRGKETHMSTTAIDGLAAAVKGRTVNRTDAGYDEARALYNAMIDRPPAAIAYCIDERDGPAAIAFARERGLRIAVRGGGHNGAGLG